MAYHTRGARFGGHSSFSAGAPMSDDDLRRVAPSIFAESAHVSRSDRYTYIPTTEILAAMRANGFVPVRAIQGRSRTEGKAEYTKHMIRFQHPDHASRRALGGISPEAVMVNSHDGTSAYGLMSGVFRSICTNSMIVMEDGATDIRVPHKGDVVGQVIDASFTVVKEATRTLDSAEAWNELRLTRDERDYLAEAAHIIRFGDAEGEVKTPIRPGQLLLPRRTEDRGDTLWQTHNVLQENCIRGGLSAIGPDANNRPRRHTTKGITNIDGDVRLNRALWQLSARMAELKAAA